MISLGHIEWSGIAGQIGTLCLTFWDAIRLLSRVAVACYTHARHAERFWHLSMSLTIFVTGVLNKYLFLFFSVYEYFACLSVHAGLTDAVRRHQIPWNCIYRWLWAPVWVLGAQPRSPVGTASTPPCWALSPVLSGFALGLRWNGESSQVLLALLCVSSVETFADDNTIDYFFFLWWVGMNVLS